ncbi:MAG: SGNH/GDSL hydrolase family protein [Betaproteobacteria bacterium]
MGGSCVSVALALVAAEGLARRWAPDYLSRTRGLYVHSRTYGWVGRPGAVAPMGSGRISLDARGYRTRPLAPPGADSRTRVIVLGDSIAAGYGVSDEQTFPRLLDARDNGIAVENLAVEGYGPGQELLVLRRDALRQQPDVVVLAVCLRNDLVDSALPVALYDGVTPRPVFRLVGGQLVLDDSPVRRTAAGRALQWLSDYSHLFNRLSALVPRPAIVQERTWRYRKREVLSDADYAFRLAMALIEEMRNECRRRGIPFLIATFPNGVSYELRPQLQERLHAALRAEGAWVLDMGARFHALGLTPAELALDDVGHLTPRGHLVSCEILEREIASQAGPRR